MSGVNLVLGYLNPDGLVGGRLPLDTWTEYNKGICDGSDWMMPQLAYAKLVGKDTFPNEDASIAAQTTRIKALSEEPDALMLCAMMPGAVSAIKQIRAAGINSMILNASGVDGSYRLSAVPDLSNFFVPVQGSIYGDDPNAEVTAFNAKYREATGSDPSPQHVYPVYENGVPEARHLGKDRRTRLCVSDRHTSNVFA